MRKFTKTKQVTRVEEVEQEVLSLSGKEIEAIVRQHVKDQGYVPGSVQFKIKWKYGQGIEVVETTFEGAEIEVE